MYIAFEGPIAAGKTTLATSLAHYLGTDVQLLLEGFADNAFLRDFYADALRWALPMQLDFLLARQAQLGRLQSSSRPIVADHSLIKQRAFARLLLQGRELALYERVAASLPPPEATPNLVVYLHAPTGELLQRVAKRGRSYEEQIDARYLENLSDAYAVQFALTPAQRVLRIDTSRINLRDEVQMHGIWHEIATQAKEAASSSRSKIREAQ